MFSSIDRLFFYKYSYFFKRKQRFWRGKAPFIFNEDRFIKGRSNTLKESITSALDPLALNKIARETGFLRRESKLKPEEFIGALLFSEFDHSRLSLQDCCNELAQYHQKPLSKVAMHKRFNLQSFGFLKAVLAKQMALKLNILECNMWQPFTRVMIADSCKFALPERYKADYPGFGGSRSKALMNIQYAFDLKQGDWETLELAQANENDKAYSKKTLNHIVEGDLHIRDLGYITHGYLAEVSTKKAFFLNRLPPPGNPSKEPPEILLTGLLFIKKCKPPSCLSLKQWWRLWEKAAQLLIAALLLCLYLKKYG